VWWFLAQYTLLVWLKIVLFSSRGGRYTEEDAKAIVLQILSVAAFCHLQGVVHRDLKPEVCALNLIPLHNLYHLALILISCMLNYMLIRM